MTNDTLYTILSTKGPKDNVITFTVEIPSDAFDRYRKRAVAAMKKNFELPGFRKGNVPDDMFLTHVNEGEILEKAAYAAVEDMYPRIIEDQEISSFGPPAITITKLAPSNPLEFTMTVGIEPDIQLPDYMAIAKKTREKMPPEDAAVSDKEANAAIDHLRMIRAQPSSSPDGDLTPPELTDEFAQSLGAFDTVEDLKNAVRENIAEEKRNAGRTKTREAIAAALVEKTRITIPKTALDHEVEKARHQLLHDLEKQQMTPEQYFVQIQKTEDEFFQEQRGHIERQMKTQVVLAAIAEKEDLKPTEEELAPHLHILRQRHPDHDPMDLAIYAVRMLANEKVLQFLEGSKPEEKNEGEESKNGS